MNKSKNKTFFKTIRKGVMSLTFAGMLTLSTFLSGCGMSGRDGKNGSIWYTGLDVAEYVNDGVDGDFFFDSDDKILYQKVSGEWVQISDIKQFAGFTPTVSINSDGYWVINGETTEFVSTGAAGNTPIIGDNGNWWIDEKDTGKTAKGLQGKSAFDLYKEQNPSFDGTLADWLDSLKGKGEQGEQGDAGATWLTGSTNPELSDGQDGDIYLNTKTFDIFKKVDGMWTCVGNIKGADGLDGYDRNNKSVKGTTNIPVILNDKDVYLHDIKLASEQQKTTFYGANRLDINSVTFNHITSVTIEKENNGITVYSASPSFDSSSMVVSYEYTAEFSGILWLSCDAELAELEDGGYGNILDVSMKMNIYRQGVEYKQGLCRGIGKLSEYAEVEKGDVVKLMFYVKNGGVNQSFIENKIKYKNIMLQYGALTDYVPYVENQTNFYIDDETDEVVYSELPDLKNYSTGCIIESEGDFTVNYSYLEQKKTLKVVSFGDSITGISTNGVDYSSVIGRISNYEAYNVGFAGTTYEDHGSTRYNPFSFNRLIDAVCSGDFTEQDNQIGNITKTEYITRLETLKSIDFNDVDYVTIFYGYNDWNYGHILKSEDDSATENKQQSNLEDAMKYSINKLKEKFPDLKIIVLTPYMCVPKVDDQPVDIEEYTKNDYKLKDFADYIKDIAETLDVEEVINLYEMTDFVNTSNYGYYMYDGVHPNSRMNQILAQIIIKTIDNLEKIK